jgi:TRAP-type C4-dicarboxylate transport system permease small subunit
MVIMAVLGYGSLDFVTNEVAIFGTRGWLAVVFPIFFALAFFRFFTQVLSVSPAHSRAPIPETETASGEPPA